MNTATDVQHRINIAWTATKKLQRLWQSQISDHHKRLFLTSMITPILLYSCESWALTPTFTQTLHGNLTRLLRNALHVPRTAHVHNSHLYGHIPRIADTLCYRRVKFAGHAIRATQQPVSQLLLQPDHQRITGTAEPTIQALLIDDLLEHIPAMQLIRSGQREPNLRLIHQASNLKEWWHDLVMRLPLRPPTT